MSFPVRIRGTVYPSKRAAARALGVSTATIENALDGGWIDEVGLGRRKGGGGPKKACVFRGNRYPSMTAAAQACGVSVSAVSMANRRRMQEA